MSKFEVDVVQERIDAAQVCTSRQVDLLAEILAATRRPKLRTSGSEAPNPAQGSYARDIDAVQERGRDLGTTSWGV